MKKIKNFISNLKFYLKILKDFSKLNNYILLSSIFMNRTEQLLSSNLDDNVILDNIRIAYTDFKINYEKEDFINGVNIKNEFSD